MEVRTLPGVASVLSADVGRLAKTAVEHLNDPALACQPALEASVAQLLDRLCLSIQLSKPVGLLTWAEREGKRLGVSGATEIASAATFALASEAAAFPIDHGRLLAFLEVLKSEIDSALAQGPRKEMADPAFSDSTVALLAMLGERDSATCCHSRATGEWTRRLAAGLNLKDEQTAFLELCAVLHDIGKISTPDSILFKQGPLDEAEWEIMRDHSAAGQRILNQIPSLQRVAVVVRAHHERWDGAGYPDGLAGMNIPFEARVVAVADAFHAMISDRPYRKAIAPRQALEILKAGRGTQWDPTIVDGMLDLFKQNAKPAVAARKASSA